MKLPFTLVVLLITLSVFGQDTIQYDNYIFSRGGKVISLEEVRSLTDDYKAGRRNFYFGEKQLFISQSLLRTVKRNTTNVFMGAFFVPGGIGVFANYPYSSDDIIPFLVWNVYGALVTSVGIYYASHISTQKRYSRKADKNFKKASLKLNQAIRDSRLLKTD
jgi:hypothetical protein